jgi:very-short-patch-repair endonuclease
MEPRAFQPPRLARPGGGTEKRGGRAFQPPRDISRIMGVEKRAVEIASQRHRIIELADLLSAGLSKDAVRRRVDSGWLTRLHPGVFSIGEPDDLGLIQAGLIACGAQATATAQSAAALDDLLPYPAAVYVAAPRNGPRPKAVEVSRPRELPRWRLRHNMRCARTEDTLLALAATATFGETLDATNEAFIKRRTNTSALTFFLNAKGSRRGASTLRQVVDGPRSRSDLERRFFALLEAARLPLPLTNVIVNGHRVDFFWPDHRLVVETDGWASHGRRQQFEADRRRDLDHVVSGLRSARITFLQLTKESSAVCARLGALLLRDVPELLRLGQ